MLLLTRQLIYYPERPPSGLYKRLTMFIDAMSQIADLNILFYINPEIECSDELISELQRRYAHHWKTNIRIYVCPIREYRDGTPVSKWLSYARGTGNFFDQRYYYETSGREQTNALESCLENKPDAIFSHRLATMCPLILTKKTLPPVFFDMDDIEHVVLRRFIKKGNLLKKLQYLLLPALYKGEARAIRLAFKTFVCSESDRRHLAEDFKSDGIVTIPNAVKIPELRHRPSDPAILFLGSYFTQNVDAARYLATTIWPLIIRRMPEARLFIAGLTKEQLGSGIRYSAGIEVLGFVDNLDELYAKSRFMAAPILVGGGTRFKIIEAASYGKPTVSTTIGAEGIDLENETEILLRDNPGDFAEACLKLLRDSELCNEIGMRARSKVIMKYDKNNVVRTIRENFSDI